MNTKNNTGVIRFSVIITAIIIQVAVFAVFVYLLRETTVYIYTLIRVIGLIKVIQLNLNDAKSPYTGFWTIVILVIPVFGELLYMIWGRTNNPGRRSRKTIMNMNRMEKEFNDFSEKMIDYKPETTKLNKILVNEGFLVYNKLSGQYIPTGRIYFEKLLIDLKKAEKFIFLEYHIIETGYIWNDIRDILVEKAEEGVEIRLIYDDLGSLSVTRKEMKCLQVDGIKILCFNQLRDRTSALAANYRNHQRIVVIDGKVAYTGSLNITDKHLLNNHQIHDNAIRIEGDGVNSMTFYFLQMWNVDSKDTDKLDDYLIKDIIHQNNHSITYQPFVDGPLNNPKNPAEKIYHQLIANARNYIYITSPFLNIDAYMTDQLCMAAECGIDVRIIIPDKFDKVYLGRVTYANAEKLMLSGVKIYKYLPGFIHSKTIISDDEYAILGTINMNYKSFYLHFENGILLSDEIVLNDIRKDFQYVLSESELIDFNILNQRSLKLRASENFFKFISPLL